jgi:uncharacterized protein YbjT (DUF2867 family)
MYAVAGVSGHTGSLVARTLLKQGERVRAIVRNREHIYKWRDRGAEVLVADLNDPMALSEALQGVKGAYLLTPQSVYDACPLERWSRQNQSIVSAVQNARVANAVFLSSMGAHRNHRTGMVQALYDAEQKFQANGVPVTLLRAAYFYENWIPALSTVQDKGRLPTFLKPKRTIPMVSVEDVARAAVDLLLHPAEAGRVVELTGPKEYSPQDILEMLESILQKKLSLLLFSDGGWNEVWGDETLPEEMTNLLNETYDGLNKQKIAFSEKNVETRRGIVTLEEMLKKWVMA